MQHMAAKAVTRERIPAGRLLRVGVFAAGFSAIANGFAEYFEPFSGEPLGSGEQSWTAAVVLDWLASGPQRELRAA